MFKDAVQPIFVGRRPAAERANLDILHSEKVAGECFLVGYHV
jgi:hypothetical protein